MSHVGPLPSFVGGMTSSPSLPYRAPKSVGEQTQEQNARQSQWEEQEERRHAKRTRLEEELRLAESRAGLAGVQLPHAQDHLKELEACRGDNAKRRLRNPGAYANEVASAEAHIKSLADDLSAPARLRARIARLDAELVGDELALVQCWNAAGIDARTLVLKLLGLRFVGTSEMHGEGIDLSKPLPTSRG